MDGLTGKCGVLTSAKGTWKQQKIDKWGEAAKTEDCSSKNRGSATLLHSWD
jgi:hypothetical protein